MQMHSNRKADWAGTARSYSNRGQSALEARTVHRWNSGRVPEKVWFCVIVKKCTADRPVLYRGPSAVQRQIGFQKHTISEWDLEMNCGPSAGEGRTVRRSTDWKTTFCDVSGGLDVQVADRPPGSSGPSARTQRRTGEAAGDKSGHGFGRGLFLKASRSV